MNRDQKAAVVDEIAGQIQAADAIFAVDYRGLSVSQAADLRAKLRDVDAKFRIVKNSLSERAAEKAGAEALKPMLEGPTALTLVHGDVALAAKALNDTARALSMLEFKGGLMNGNALSADEVRSIARLPSRDVLNAQLVGTIAAPLSGLVRGLNALIAGVAIQLQALIDQGLVSGEAPAGFDSAVAVAPAEPSEVASPPLVEAEPEPEAATQAGSEGASSPEAATQASEAEAPSEPPAPDAPAEALPQPDSLRSQEAADAEPGPEAAAEPEPEAPSEQPEPEATAEPWPAAAAEPEAATVAESEAAAEPEPEAAAEPGPGPEPTEEEAASDAAPSDE